MTALLLTGVYAHAGELVPRALDCADQLFDGKAKYNEEISGIKCLPVGKGAGICYIVADEKKALQQIYIQTTGRNSFECIPGPVLAKKRGLSCLKGKKAERDFEAIASDDRYLFITGSLGNQRKKHVGKSPERWALIRQQLAGIDQLEGDCEAVKRKDLISLVKNASSYLRSFIDKPLQCGGINVEGLAVQNDQLYFGLRSPGFIQEGVALVVEASASGIFSGRMQAHLHKLKFQINGHVQQGIGIRALESIGDGQFLVATGAAGVTMINLSEKGAQRIASQCVPGKSPFYLNKVYKVPRAIWMWTPATGHLKHLGNIAGRYQTHKLEGLAVLARRQNKLDLVLTFDGVDNDKMSPLATITVDLH